MRAAIYTRRSSPGEEAKNYSIENQLLDCRRYAEERGIEVVKEYKDTGGKSYLLQRPVFQQLLLDAKANVFELLLVWRYDRFSRVQEQAAVARYQLKQYGVKVISAAQPVPEGAVGNFVIAGMDFAANFELEGIRARFYAGKIRRVQKGHLPQAAIPRYGYRFAGEKRERYEPDPETAPIVQRIYALSLQGKSLNAIGRLLDQEGVPTPTQLLAQRGQLSPKWPRVSSLWSASTLHSILASPLYKGEHSGFRTKYREEERRDPITGEVALTTRRVLRDEEDEAVIRYGHDVAPPLVDAQTWEATQQVLKRNKENSPRNIHNPHSVLLRSGFIRCGHCHKAMAAAWSKPDRQYRYTCRCAVLGRKLSYRSAEMDALVWSWLLHQFSRPVVLRDKFEQWLSEQKSQQAVEMDQLAVIEGQITAAERRRANYMRSAGDADVEEDRAEWAAKATEQRKFIRGLQQQRESLSHMLVSQTSRETAVGNLLELGAAVKERLEGADYADKRRILYAFGVQVTCWTRDHFDSEGLPEPYHVNWRFDPLHEA